MAGPRLLTVTVRLAAMFSVKRTGEGEAVTARSRLNGSNTARPKSCWPRPSTAANIARPQSLFILIPWFGSASATNLLHLLIPAGSERPFTKNEDFFGGSVSDARRLGPGHRTYHQANLLVLFRLRPGSRYP